MFANRLGRNRHHPPSWRSWRWALIAQKRWGIPVYANHRTAAELGLLNHHTHAFEALDVLQFGNGISLLPVPVPHAGADNVAFVASHGGERSPSSRIWAVGRRVGSPCQRMSTHRS